MKGSSSKGSNSGNTTRDGQELENEKISSEAARSKSVSVDDPISSSGVDKDLFGIGRLIYDGTIGMEYSFEVDDTDEGNDGGRNENDGNEEEAELPEHLHEQEDNEDDEGGERPSKKRKEPSQVQPRSDVWSHFHKFVDLIDNMQQGKCNYCGRVIKAEARKHGTTSLRKHLDSCKKKPQAVALNQPRVVLQPSERGDN